MAGDMLDDEDGPAPVHDGSPWPWLVGTAAPILSFLFIIFAYDSINQPEPQVGQAVLMYLVAAAAGTWTVVVAILRYGDHMQFIGLLGGIGAVILGVTMAAFIQDSYGALGGLGWILVFGYFILPAYLIGYTITLVVLGLREGVEGVAKSCMAWGLMGAGASLIAAMYHLLTINMQARLAREAHEASAVAVVLVAAVLGVGAWLSRRSKC